MTPIKWLIIAWSVQTILLLILIYDLHARLSINRKFAVAITTYLGIDIGKILEIVQAADEGE